MGVGWGQSLSTAANGEEANGTDADEAFLSAVSQDQERGALTRSRTLTLWLGLAFPKKSYGALRERHERFLKGYAEVQVKRKAKEQEAQAEADADITRDDFLAPLHKA